MGLSPGVTKLKADVGIGNERRGPEGSLPQQIYLVKYHGTDDEIMEVRKLVGKDIELVD